MSDPVAPSAPAAPSSAAPSSTPNSTSAPKSAATPSAPPRTSGDPRTASEASASLPGGASEVGKDTSPVETSAAEKAAHLEKFRFKHKIDGREVEKEYTRDEIARELQKREAAELKFQKAAEVQKQFQQFIEDFKKDPFAAPKSLGLQDLDLMELAEQKLYQRFQEEELKAKDPRAFEFNQLKQENDRLKAEHEARQAEMQKRAQEEADMKVWQQTEPQWIQALQESGLAGSRPLMREMIKIGQEFLEQGIDLEPRQIAAELKGRMAEQTRSVLGGLKGESLIAALGEDLVNEILQFKIAQVRKAKPVQEPIHHAKASASNSDEPAPRRMKTTHSLREFRKFLQGDE